MSGAARRILTVLEGVQHAPEERPRSRNECRAGERPCPWVSCRYHLAIEVDDRTGHITERPALYAADASTPTCAIDVADSGEQTLEQIGALLGVTRERVRQIETAGLSRMQRAATTAELAPEGTPAPHVSRRPRKAARDGREGRCQNPACGKRFVHYASRGYMPALCPACKQPHIAQVKRARRRRYERVSMRKLKRRGK